MTCPCHQIIISFAFYWKADDEPPFPSYIVVEGEVPGLFHKGMNISVEQILAAGLPLPLTPSFEQWTKDGSKAYRGE